MVVKRNNFGGCEIFTSKISLQSILGVIEEVTLPETGKIHILDAFCGDGIVGKAVLKYLSAKSHRDYYLTFADDNPKVLKKIRKKIKLPYYQTRLCDLTKPNKLGSFNLITIRYGLHDLSCDNKENAVKYLSEMLAPNGAIVLCDIIPEKRFQQELTYHHQAKENLCNGPNKNVYLATAEEYIQLLNKYNIKAKIKDSFLQEVHLRNWLGTLGIDSRIIKKYENFTLRLSTKLKDYYQVFEHPTKGVKMYYPVATIFGVKK